MHVFLDFEASSLSDTSYPIEVGWVFEDGRAEAHLIRPAPSWTDWDEIAGHIHGISREQLDAEGEPHDDVARRMIEVLSGHDLLASAPSWDGKWLSVLLRAAGLPRYSLRLRGTRDAADEAVRRTLAAVLAGSELQDAVEQVLADSEAARSARPASHRALADAEEERRTWFEVLAAAEARASLVRRPCDGISAA